VDAFLNNRALELGKHTQHLKQRAARWRSRIDRLPMVFSFMLGANVLVEKVFAWPGLGSYAVEALIASDYAPVQGFVLMMALLYVLLNLVIDLVYGLVDPRVRLEA
jgi:peptide/nickel transport system permease protein